MSPAKGGGNKNPKETGKREVSGKRVKMRRRYTIAQHREGGGKTSFVSVRGE